VNDAAYVPLPRFVQIEPVGQCNLACTMCAIQFRHPDGARNPEAFLSYEAFCALVNGFGGISELHLQGLGEPLMHPHFFRMVRYAAGRGIVVSTNSNLTMLTPARAAQCVDSGLDAMHVSIDGASASVYERIRRGASFRKVVRNLGRLMAARAEAASAKPRVRIVVVAMRMNLHELSGIVALAHDHGVHDVFVQHLSHDFGEKALPPVYRPMRDFVSAETLLGADPKRVVQCFEAARAKATELGVNLRLPPVEPGAEKHGPPGCDWPWRGAYVTYAGDALPCCMVSTADRMRMGNMLQDGVVAVWDNAAYRDLRRGLASNEPPHICRSCAVYNRTF
jgi:radical SAM protein with 4Fe4S-binding SPASM domain